MLRPRNANSQLAVDYEGEHELCTSVHLFAERIVVRCWFGRNEPMHMQFGWNACAMREGMTELKMKSPPPPPPLACQATDRNVNIINSGTLKLFPIGRLRQSTLCVINNNSCRLNFWMAAFILHFVSAHAHNHKRIHFTSHSSSNSIFNIWKFRNAFCRSVVPAAFIDISNSDTHNACVCVCICVQMSDCAKQIFCVEWRHNNNEGTKKKVLWFAQCSTCLWLNRHNSAPKLRYFS